MRNLDPFRQSFAPLHKSGRKADPFSQIMGGHLQADELRDLELIQCLTKMRQKNLSPKYYNLSGLSIGFRLPDGRRVYLPIEHAQRHLALIGRTRAGKTNEMMWLFESLARQNNCSLIVIDRGDLISGLLSRMGEHWEDVILVRISDTEFPVGINLLNLARFQPERIIGEFTRLLNLISSEKLTDPMTHLLRRTLRALLCRPDATLLDIEPFLFDADFRAGVLRQVRDPELRYFWQHRYPQQEKSFRGTAQAIITRLDLIIGDPSSRYLLCQPETLIPIQELVNGNRNLILLLDLNSRDEVSGMVGELIARVFLIILHSLALSRSFHHPKPIFLLADEVQTYLEPASLSEILARGAKYGIHLVCAFQYLAQLGDLWQALEGNMGSLFCFTLGADDARKVAKSFPGTDPQEFVALPRFQMLARVNDDEGTYCFKVRTLPLEPIYGDSSSRIISNSRQRFARPRAEVEAEFQRRRESFFQKADMEREPESFVEGYDPIA